jgi:hypothetical protein
LGDRDIVGDVNMVLIVKPNSFANPRVASNVEFPGKLDPSSRSKDNSGGNFCSEKSKGSNAQSRTYLPGVRDEEQLDKRP